MCGIAGFVSSQDTSEHRNDAVGRMCTAMLHRGPDDGGVVSIGDATLGMRRLAIFDPANGHQPMATPDGRFHIVFNGAIYNFRDLRDQLATTGVVFRTNCDTEVLLAAYAHWGAACLSRLRGMFAFAVWDTSEQTLFFARDPFGIKPLYYRQQGTQLLFASELNALNATGAFSPEISPQSVADYLAWFAVPAPQTIYRGIFSLRPGECAIFHHGRLDIRSAWNFRSIPKGPVCASTEEFSHELRLKLEDTIRAHIAADVPVGAFLSGGLDSAVVVGLMTRLSGQRLKTFSIGFNEPSYSEAAAAEETARYYGAQHHASVLTGSQVAHDLERIIAAYDQPTGDGINTFYASKAARDGGVTVALSGLGGDELLGGYPSFRTSPQIATWLPFWRTLPRSIRNAIAATLLKRDTRYSKLADILKNARNFQEICSMQRRVFSEGRRRALLSDDAKSASSPHTPFHPELVALSADLKEADVFKTVSAWELRTYMADVLLRDSDVMSMRHSLELRVPFVDRPLIEWLWNQQENFKENRQHPKSSLVAAMRDVLPPALANRRKRGFSLPFAEWMHRELRPFLDDTFTDASIGRSGLFNPRPVQDLWRSFQTRDDERQWSRVWSLAVLITFINRRPALGLSSGIPARLPIPIEPRLSS